MTLNLNSNEWISLDPTKWTALETEVCMNVANAKLNAFVVEAYRLAEFTRLGFISRATAADCLHEAAIYNQAWLPVRRRHDPVDPFRRLPGGRVMDDNNMLDLQALRYDRAQASQGYLFKTFAEMAGQPLVKRWLIKGILARGTRRGSPRPAA